MATIGKKGVLLINLGTPDSPSRGDVYRYLKEFLLDWRVIDVNPIFRNLLVRGYIAPFRSGESAKLYKQVWTEEGSPLKVYGYQLAEQVQKSLGDEFIVELAMRYQNPSISKVLDKLFAQHISELIVLPLYPQYASASTGSTHEELMRLLAKKQVIPKITFINSFHDHPTMIEAFVARGREHNIEDYDHVLFSYHGLPERQLVKADSCNHCLKTKNCCDTLSYKNQHCYSAQCYGTTRALVNALELTEDQYSVSFQSRLGKNPWREPFTLDVLRERSEKGDKRILVFCPAFVADCLETNIEISVEYAEEFKKMGGEHLQLVEGLNVHPVWVKAVVEMILENVKQPLNIDL